LSVSLIASLNISALAQEVVIVQKGQEAPFTGLLFTKERADVIRDNEIALDGQKKLNTSLNLELTFKDSSLNARKSEIDILMAQNDKLSKSLMEERSVGSWERLSWVAVGILASGLAFYGLQKVQK